MAPQVIVVNLGPKNPHFDESIFPHLHFYYTPGIKAVLPDENAMNHSFEIQGKPGFLVTAVNEKQINEFGFLLSILEGQFFDYNPKKALKAKYKK